MNHQSSQLATDLNAIYAADTPTRDQLDAARQSITPSIEAARAEANTLADALGPIYDYYDLDAADDPGFDASIMLADALRGFIAATDAADVKGYAIKCKQVVDVTTNRPAGHNTRVR